MRRTYRLPEELRDRLATPLGTVYTAEETKGEDFDRLVRSAPMAVTVGDRVTDTIAAMGRTPDVQVVDGVERRVARELPTAPYARLIRVRNPPGTLTAGAIAGMKKAFMGKKPARVHVDGEEDLMAMLAIAMAPVAATVFYGQPGVGIVAVKANAVSKSRNRVILAKMGVRDIR